MKKDQQRALSDYTCAARKLIVLFRSEGLNSAADLIEKTLARARSCFGMVKNTSVQP